MKVWTAHEKPHAAPVLVRDGFSFGALFFGPLWLAAYRAWLPAGVVLLLNLLIPLLTRPPASIVLMAGLVLIVGFSGRDLVRWSIARNGYLETNIVTGRNKDDAMARLLAARPDLLQVSMVAEAAP